MALAPITKLIMIVALLLNGYIATAGNANNSGYDFCKPILQWPKSFCRRPNITCRNANLLCNEFTIHGLWPGRVYGTDPSDPSVESKIANLKPYLPTKWYNARDVTSKREAKSLWIHEKDSHGKRSILMQSDYFNRNVTPHLYTHSQGHYGVMPSTSTKNKAVKERPSV